MGPFCEKEGTFLMLRSPSQGRRRPFCEKEGTFNSEGKRGPFSEKEIRFP